MPSGPTLYTFLYLSRLAEGFDFATFKPIAVRARERNRGLGITGTLLFDGERFCQLLEGGPVEVRALAQQIEADPRHADFAVLHEGLSGASRLRADWSSGYCDADDLDVLDGTAGLRGAAAMRAFLAVAARADLLD
jgi:hypothetical protein